MNSKSLKGLVVSDKMKGTCVIALEMPKRHPVYGKLMKYTKRIKARNDINAKIGNMVRFVETRPYSKGVSYKVLSVEAKE